MRLEVKKLFGKYDYNVNFDKKMNVLIGENGTGKSTLLKIISFILNKDYIGLSKVKFDKLIVEYEDKKMIIYHKDLQQNDFTKDNNFVFALDEYLFSDKLFELLEVETIDDMIENLNKDNCIKNLFDCSGIFDAFLKDLKSYCSSKLSYNDFDINPDDSDVIFELDKPLFNISDSDKQNPNLYLRYECDYTEYNFVYGSNMYLKRLFIFSVYLKVFHYKLSALEKTNKFFDDKTISLSTAFHNFVSFKDENKYTIETANYNDKVKFYALLNDLILEKANIESKEEFLTKDEKIRISKVYKEFIEMSQGSILDSKVLQMKDGTITGVNSDIEKVRINPKDYFGKIYGENIDIIFDEDFDGTIKISTKREIYDPLVWFNITYCAEEQYKDYWPEYNYISCFKNIAANFEELMSFKRNENYINFKTLFSKYFINKSVDIIGKDTEIYDTLTGTPLKEENLSSGEYKLLRILKILFFSKEKSVVLLDEPELSLSIYWQEMLLDDILAYSKAAKVIIATQSPNLINEDQLDYLIEIKKEKGE